MWTSALTLAALGAAVAGCTTARTILLPSYVLENGQRLQDVVTIGGESAGDAPSVTVVKTFDVSAAGDTVLVSHDSASSPSAGTVIAGGIAGAIPHAAAAVGIAAIHNNRRPTVRATITTNVANANDNNSAASTNNSNVTDVSNSNSATASNSNSNTSENTNTNDNNNTNVNSNIQAIPLL